MSTILVNDAGASQHFTNHAWILLLLLAERYGWQPAGTLPGDISALFDSGTPAVEIAAQCMAFEANWDGNYSTNGHQVVTAPDARALAEALNRALPYLPDHKSSRIRPHRYVPTIELVDANITPHEFFGGPNKQRVIDFLEFAREGAFRIY
jgi:hypothetical protein